MNIPSAVSRLLAKLSVSRKLMLIYVLDLSAVVFITTVLVQEQFITIDFARQEMVGNRYIDGVRDDLIAVADETTPASAVHRSLGRLQDSEARHGRELQSAEAQAALAAAYTGWAAALPPDRPAAVAAVLERGRSLITRIGNQSNLILDPDLDSYYTMSLVVLRFPELLELVHGTRTRFEQSLAVGQSRPQIGSEYLLLAGRLDALRQGIESDYAEAMAAGGAPLAASLRPGQESLRAALDTFRAQAAALARPQAGAEEGLQRAALEAAGTQLLAALKPTWSATGQALDQLLQARVSSLYTRMAKRLASALAMLTAILLMVYVVARHIVVPLKQLTGVTDAVRKSGDHSRRASWRSEDEIGQLVVGFNDMLAQLDHEREMQKERAASDRAASTQRELIEALPVAMVVTAFGSQDVLHANARGAEWLDGRRLGVWDACLEPEARTRLLEGLQHGEPAIEFEARWLGGRVPVWTVLSARRLQYQGQDAVLAAFAPVNRMQVMERSLDLWGNVFEAAIEGILILDAQRRVIAANSAFTRQTGHPMADLPGADPGALLALDKVASADGTLWTDAARTGHWQGEVRVTRRDGSVYPCWLIVGAVWPTGAEGGSRRPDDVLHYIATFVDISDRKQSEERIRFLAERDALTELPNRVVCTERLRLAVHKAQGSGQKVAVLFIDLDHFKEINDSLGHHIGDALLRRVAKILVAAVRANDTVSRLGGDEFVIVLNGVNTVDEIAEIIDQRLLPNLRTPQDVDGSTLRVSCSLGVALYPDDAQDAETLMRHADTAMYQAKADGRDAVQFFNPEMTVRAQARRLLEADLRQALEAGQLSLHWQPRVDARSERLVGVEGLLRWKHPVRGMVPPDQFISLAEDTGLIVPIGAWVICEACRQIADWRAQGVRPFGVSINLSARQLSDDALVQVVGDGLRRHGVEPGALELELTESMVMERAERNLRQLHALRELGLRLSIDDFGTGYSSLAYLSRFPIDKLKIDRSFVLDMLNNPSGRAITMAIISLGHALGLKVVAEGVEDARMAAVLREASCDELQGFHFARAMPAAELLEWMARREAGEAEAETGRGLAISH